MALDYKQIIEQVKKKDFKTVYLLHGDESYYIDLISDAILENALEEHEKDFNLNITYGLDAEPGSLINDAKGYPMMAERRLVILREAQNMRDIELMESYMNAPTPSTVFVICYKHGALRANTKLYKAISKNKDAIIFKSDKIKDYKIVEHITTVSKSLGYPISPKAANLLGEFLGTDLSKIHAEIDKLAILVEKGTTINEVHVEENIGISKDYNVFELVNAVGKRDVVKAFKIVDYFQSNPKSGELVPVIAQLFRHFSALMKMHFLKGSDDENAKKIPMHPYAYKLTKPQLKIYPPKKISANIGYLHEYDLKSKGVGNASFTQGDLMRELVYKLMH